MSLGLVKHPIHVDLNNRKHKCIFGHEWNENVVLN